MLNVDEGIANRAPDTSCRVGQEKFVFDWCKTRLFKFFVHHNGLVTFLIQFLDVT